ncbi:sigma-70 family RNA polymerase sigma factor [Streptomyces somaliensis]|uniref:sigma-70 family RNA polymerase sigma factor n=1 Tax=Streptomyces somaliensis TaxID=78355 RepID=UPI0020CD27C2|nr:sigma-70 family RNA polymerase sigma factor [Streptomyces somaliensis]MCP9944202.1 sigma-70 family RNA polymerase sigma factor [Streptomyces somaliensis]MCP9962560.1 sigma-70 family RNA polymerase sigma factor [Streptomyces somaliensis]MCP9975387.1 sigma-70 family RNA polymerase sigma factor [Streptomyces somaliensis]
MPTHPSGVRDRAAVPGDDQITEWALAAARGDASAAEDFVSATRPHVWRFIVRACGDAQSADDLTQETYLRALRSLPRFAARCHARAWLLSIARRVVVDRYRSNAARPRLADTADWQTAAERAQQTGLPGFDEGVALLDLLESLDRPRRESFILTQVRGLSYEEAASVAGCPIGTVRSRVNRARQNLTRLLRSAESAA